MLFLSCFRWNNELQEWNETGHSVNLSNVEQIHMTVEASFRQPEGIVEAHCIDAIGISGGSYRLVEGGLSQDHACRLLGALLSSAGVPHYPELPKVDIEHERKPGTIGHEPPGSN